MLHSHPEPYSIIPSLWRKIFTVKILHFVQNDSQSQDQDKDTIFIDIFAVWSDSMKIYIISLLIKDLR